MTHQDSLQWTKFAGGREAAPASRARRRLVVSLIGLPLLVGAAALAGCAGSASEVGPMRDMARGSAAKRANRRWGYRDHAR